MKALLLTGIFGIGIALTGCDTYETVEYHHGHASYGRSSGYYRGRDYGHDHRRDRRTVNRVNVYEQNVYRTNQREVNRVVVNEREHNRNTRNVNNVSHNYHQARDKNRPVDRGNQQSRGDGNRPGGRQDGNRPVGRDREQGRGRSDGNPMMVRDNNRGPQNVNRPGARDGDRKRAQDAKPMNVSHRGRPDENRKRAKDATEEQRSGRGSRTVL